MLTQQTNQSLNHETLPIFPEEERYSESTVEIVSRVAYLIGVNEKMFETIYSTEIFEALENDKPARIIRHLSILRNEIEHNYRRINEQMRTAHRTLPTMNDLVSMDSMEILQAEGVNWYQKRARLDGHVIDINKIVKDRINNCSHLFERYTWLRWDYIKDLFILPTTEDEMKDAAEKFYLNKSAYPFRIIINWEPREERNILHNDKIFCELLYKANNDEFSDYSRVTTVGATTTTRIDTFIEKGKKTVILVDCENADPFKFCAAVLSIAEDDYIKSKISEIVLFNDVNTSSAWRKLKNFTDIPIKEIMIDRITSKSRVDMTLAVECSKMHLQDGVDSFILASSDSDYYSLINSLHTANFLVMIEDEITSKALKEKLIGDNVFYAKLDTFYTGGAEFETFVLADEIAWRLESALNLNVFTMFDETLQETRIEMDDKRKEHYMNKLMRGGIELKFNEETGEAKIVLKR